MTVIEILCEAVIPVLGLLLIAAAYPGRVRVTLRRVAASLGWAYLLHFTDQWLDLWPRMGLDFSTHSAVAIAVGMTLAGAGRKWLIATIVLWIAYAAMMMYLGYHTGADIGTTVLAVLPGVVLCQRIPGPKGRVGA